MVENDRVVAGGMRYQGPLMNLFQLEIPADERLFDRWRVADIVTESS